MFHGIKQKWLSILVGVLAICAIAAPPLWVRSRFAMAETLVVEDRSAIALGQAIRKLGVVASVLHTGAHPDDEDSGLLAYLARGRQARTAYLSLTRGDGGQNVIGPEIYEPLGVIRTEELLAARRLDGASQYFSRAFDFGFSKSRKETLSKWDREQVLSDIVRTIRTFRPMVIVSAWSGTPNDGHGHHQAAGLLTREAYYAAADPARFPEQLKEGLRPWQAKKLYIRSFDGAASPNEFLPALSTLSINTGEFDPLLGRSYYEIAARGRSQHRSQDEGTIEARGPRYSRLRLIDSKVGPIKNEDDIFQDLDISVMGIERSIGKSGAGLNLSEVQRAADEAKQKFNPLSPGSVSSIIAEGLKRLRATREQIRVNGDLRDKDLSVSLGSTRLTAAEQRDVDFLLKQKEADFADALAKSQGIAVDCLTDDQVVTPGQTFGVTVSCYAGSHAKINGVSLSVPDGWNVVQQKQTSEVTGGQLVSQTEFKVTVGPNPEFTSPYWLKEPRRGDMFAVSPSRQGPGSKMTGIEPVEPGPLAARVQFQAEGESLDLIQPAQFRFADRALGEIRRELKVAPAISVTVAPDVIVYPISTESQQREVTASVINNATQGQTGSVRLQAPAGWIVEPAEAPFSLKRQGERAAITFTVRVPPQNSESRNVLNAVAACSGKEYRRGYHLISYPHIESRFFYTDATVEAEVMDVKVASGLKVGYIEGAGDDFANALRRIGVDVKTIEAKELASGDLTGYDTIVAGIRVYEVRPDVVANNARLMDFVNRGGTYIVQYNRGDFETGGYGPYRFSKEMPLRRSRRESQPRLLYLNEKDLASALVPKSGSPPRLAVFGADSEFIKNLGAAATGARAVEPSEFDTADLSPFDVIVIAPGVKTSEQPNQTANQRLLEFARQKLVIISYSDSQYASGDFPTFPRPEARPFRTTDEQAPVTILEPDHPRFNYPNKIGTRDFGGWVQERGAYFLSDWDPHYKPLMSCHDPGEPDLKGGEVIAEYGRGLYVYTAYAWFRQLPKEVPGAYRLIANLVSLPKARTANGRTN